MAVLFFLGVKNNDISRSAGNTLPCNFNGSVLVMSRGVHEPIPRSPGSNYTRNPPHTQNNAKSHHTLTRPRSKTKPHTHTHAYIPSARDGSVTIGKQRLLVTENELGLGLGSGEQKRGLEEVLGLLAGLQSE